MSASPSTAALLLPRLNYLDRMLLKTMRESETQAISMANVQFGPLTFMFLWVYGALNPFAGFLADGFNRSRVIVGSLFLWSLKTRFTSRATGFGLLNFFAAGVRARAALLSLIKLWNLPRLTES